jgi:hypothetical protein
VDQAPSRDHACARQERAQANRRESQARPGNFEIATSRGDVADLGGKGFEGMSDDVLSVSAVSCEPGELADSIRAFS